MNVAKGARNRCEVQFNRRTRNDAETKADQPENPEDCGDTPVSCDSEVQKTVKIPQVLVIQLAEDSEDSRVQHVDVLEPAFLKPGWASCVREVV